MPSTRRRKAAHTAKAAAPQTPSQGGRPLAEINLALVDQLGRIHCTDAEIAVGCGVHPDTFRRRLKVDQELRDVLDAAREHGRISLRRLQWQAAQNGRLAMLIWLGKQILGQTDLTVVSIDEPAGGADLGERIKEILSARHRGLGATPARSRKRPAGETVESPE